MSRPRRIVLRMLPLVAAVLCLAALLLGPSAAPAQTPVGTPTPAADGSGPSARVREIIPRVVRINDGVDRYTRSDRAGRTDVALFTDVLFAFDSARLSPAAGDDLAEVATLIREQARGTVRVHGHTDSIGDERYNLQLSRRRAEAVRDALARLLSDRPTEFQVRGLGETEPIAPNTKPGGGDNPEGRRLNRRVTVSFDR
jgi:outer membrane protein OmpA-like peptidoglycan-associated protein